MSIPQFGSALRPRRRHTGKAAPRRPLLLEPLEDRVALNAPHTGWDLSFVDEFNGASIDRSRWATQLAWSGDDGSYRHHNSSYLSYIMDDDVIVSGGTLKLRTQRRRVYNPMGRPYDFTEGLIQTAATFSQTYGYFEIRAKLPVGMGRGLWPAFWMLRPTDGWPPEMDIGEWWTSDNRSHQGLAYNSGGVRWDDYNTYSPLPGGWHTYALEWSAGRQVYSIDGRVRHTINASYVPNVPMYVILNSGVESARPPDGNTVFPNNFEVDYIRVYRQVGSGAVLRNPEFELDPPGASWALSGGAQVVGYNERTGNRTVRIDDAPGRAEQVVTGLAPNTTYTLGGWTRVSNGAAEVRLGVRNHGGPEQWASNWNTSYTRQSVVFTTGPTHTQAALYCFKPFWGHAGECDDLYLLRAPTIAGIPDRTTNYETPTGPIPITVGNVGTAGGWSVIATSSNTAIVPNQNIQLGGSGLNRTLTATPAGGQTGETTITVAASDAYGGVGTTSFQLRVIPSMWSSVDIGSVGARGSYDLVGDTITVRGSGADIWGTSDAFHFLAQPVLGDGYLLARVGYVANTDPWAKAGVMIRESLAASSRHALLAVTPSSGVAFQRRAETGGSSASTAVGGVTAPYWVLLYRWSEYVFAYAGDDSGNWYDLGWDRVAMGATVWVGLAVTSHNNQALNTSMFDYVWVDFPGTAPGRASASDADAGLVTALLWDHRSSKAPFATRGYLECAPICVS